MDNRLFKTITTGVCSYFLILYSCMKLLQKLRYSAEQDNLVWYLLPFAVPVLMLAGGIYLAVLNKKKPDAFTDNENRSVSAAAAFIGGWAVLAIVLNNIAPGFLFGMISGLFEPGIFLYPFVFNGPFLIAAAVIIRTGSLKNETPSSSAGIRYLCLRTVLMIISTVSVYRILSWFGPLNLVIPHGIAPAAIKWIVSEAVFAAAALILLMAPLRLKSDLKNTDRQRYAGLLGQSFTLGGYLLLIVGISEICGVVIHKYDFFDRFFFEPRDFLAQLLPALLLVLTSLLFLYFGRKRERAES